MVKLEIVLGLVSTPHTLGVEGSGSTPGYLGIVNICDGISGVPWEGTGCEMLPAGTAGHCSSGDHACFCTLCVLPTACLAFKIWILAGVNIFRNMSSVGHEAKPHWVHFSCYHLWGRTLTSAVFVWYVFGLFWLVTKAREYPGAPHKPGLGWPGCLALGKQLAPAGGEAAEGCSLCCLGSCCLHFFPFE